MRDSGVNVEPIAKQCVHRSGVKMQVIVLCRVRNIGRGVDRPCDEEALFPVRELTEMILTSCPCTESGIRHPPFLRCFL